MTVEPLPTFHGDPARAATPQGLADRRELALVALERTRMPMVVSDPRLPDNPIILTNQAFLNLTGYTAAEVIGRNCRFLQGPETKPQAVATIREAIREQRDCDVEILNFRKDGSSFWNMLHLSPIHDDNGELIYFFASQKDITKRREAQAQEEVEHQLLKEVDHRAKNAMALVQAVTRLSRADTAEAYKTAVQGRVQALARAHELLAARRWTGAPLDEVVQSEIRDGERVAVDGPPVDLPPLHVQPFMLFLHEMMSNAESHGALAQAAGSLTISWRTVPGPAPALALEWREEGGPPPAQERRQGFGSFMIKAVVERQLRGAINLDWRADGLRADLHMPLVAVAEQSG